MRRVQAVQGQAFIKETRRKCALTGRKRVLCQDYRTTSNSNVLLPLRSVPRTGCVGHCGNPRLKGGRKKERECQLVEFSDGSNNSQRTATSCALETRK